MQVSHSESPVWAAGKYMLYLKTECMWGSHNAQQHDINNITASTKQPSVNIVYGSNIHLSWPPPSPHLGVECDMWYVETFALVLLFYTGFTALVWAIVSFPYHGTLEPGVGAALQAVLHVPVLLQLRALPGDRGQAGGQPGHHAAALAGDSRQCKITYQM